MFGVPQATLSGKLNGRTPLGAKSGPAPLLTPAEETRLATYILNMADVGYPLTKFEILHQVKNIIDVDKRPNHFINNLPGREWFANFFTRNPSLTMRTPLKLGTERALITYQKVEWYRKLYEFLAAEVPDYQTVL